MPPRDRSPAALILMSEVAQLRAQVDAHPASHVNSHSWRTLAEKGARCVDAFAIDAHSRKYLTLIHVLTDVSFDSSKAFTADWIFFTFGTGAVPGFSQCGTAVGFQCGPVDVDLTPIIDHLQPASALNSLYALQPGAVQGATR